MESRDTTGYMIYARIDMYYYFYYNYNITTAIIINIYYDGM